MKSRILELSHRHKLGHLSSNLTTSEVFRFIFETYGTDAVVLLSSGHAGLSLYVALEKYRGADAEKLLLEKGPQPRPGGSLGQGITLAVGIALADRNQNVHCIVSDGECAEGCVWESLAFARNYGLRNLHVHVNVNGYSALSAVDVDYLTDRLKVFLPWVEIHRTHKNQLPFLRGLHAHYKVMSDEEYKTASQVWDEADAIKITFTGSTSTCRTDE